MIALIKVHSNMTMVCYDENGNVVHTKNLLEDVVKHLEIDDNTLLQYPLAPDPVKLSSWFDVKDNNLPAT